MNSTRNLASVGAVPQQTALEFEFYDMLKSVSTISRDRNYQFSVQFTPPVIPVLTAVRTGNLTHVTSVERVVYRESVSWDEGGMFLGNNDNHF